MENYFVAFDLRPQLIATERMGWDPIAVAHEALHCPRISPA